MVEGAEFQDTGYFWPVMEFDYARRAIQLESVEYLLKPIDFEKLEEALKKAEQAVLQENMISKTLQKRVNSGKRPDNPAKGYLEKFIERYQ